MSRAMNVKLSEEEVTRLCRKAGVSISAIERLPSEGTHLVCVTGEGADEMRVVLKKHIIVGPVKRFPFYRA
jgi:hypothetical protein